MPKSTEEEKKFAEIISLKKYNYFLFTLISPVTEKKKDW